MQEALLQRSGSGTGDILRANFQVLVRTVREQDAHLLVPEETQLLDQFQVRIWSLKMLSAGKCQAAKLLSQMQCKVDSHRSFWHVCS